MRNYDSIYGVKNQGVVFNTDFSRWEYYGKHPVIRAGEPQPEFVSGDYQKCVTYKMNVEGKADEMSV